MTKKLTVYISLALLLIIFAFPLSACTQNKTTSSVDTKSTSQPKTKEVWVMTKSENRSLTYVYYDQQFDRSGNMISQKRSPRMKDGVEVTTYNYSYRDDGTLESSTENTHQKEGNKDYERYWSYDEHGNAASERSSQYKDYFGEDQVFTYTNTYDENGNLAKQVITFPSHPGKTTTPEKTTTYSYNSQGIMTSFIEAQDGFKTKHSCTYDEHGNLIKEDIQGLKKSSDSWTKFYEYESMIVEVP